MAIVALGPVVLRAVGGDDADVGRLRVLLADLAVVNGSAATAVPGAEAVRAWLAEPDRCWLIAERAGRLVGLCFGVQRWALPSFV